MKITQLLRPSNLMLLAIPLLISTQLNGQFILNGTAFQLDETCYQLTPAAPNSIASIWSEEEIDLNNSFDFKFNLNFGCTDIGADGMVFVLQTSSSALGQSGGDIGYGLNFNPSLAVEFDTYNNIVNADLDADHIAIIRNGIVDHNNPNSLAGPIVASPTSNNIEDCEDHPVRVIWDADNQVLEVYFDCVLRLSYNSGDIINDIFGGDPMVFWGFTASTGGKTNVQSICFDSFESIVMTTNQTLDICDGESIQISGTQSNIDYTWSPVDGLSDPNINNPIASPAENITYIATGMDQCDNEFIDTFNIVVNALNIDFQTQPAISSLSICEGQTIDLSIQTDTNNDILWPDGSSDPLFVLSEGGNYEIIISNACSDTTITFDLESSNCEVAMPNVFTPDSDGLNDIFSPVSDGTLEITQFKIFNRWGDIVFDDLSQQGWDGNHNGKAAPSDVYVYIIEFSTIDGSQERLVGDVTLIR